MEKERVIVSKPLKPKKPRRLSAAEREKILIDNFIGLQKVMVNLSMKFENLSDNITKLLGVFENSARDYMVNKGRSSPDKDREYLTQLNTLLEQNKAISRGIMQLDERLRSSRQVSESPQKTTVISALNNNLPKMETQAPAGYEPSIQNSQFKQKSAQG
ncbi:Uncharacterised protein [uncultured archaeon]|nr:Uncharacterised protein [uncultured archaeon]